MQAGEHLVEFILTHKDMPRDKAKAISERFTVQKFEKNSFVLIEGQRCREYHFLVNGFMRSWTNDLDGREITTAFHPAGTVVCELFSFFKNVPAGENIQALTLCEVLTITFSELQNAFHSLPEFREFGRSILINAYAELKHRMLSSLHHTAEERYKQMLITWPQLFHYASLKQIASFLGVTDTSLSRIRASVAKGGA